MPSTINYTDGSPMEPMETPPVTSAIRRPLFPAIRWGAVLAGVAVGISVQLALTLFGIATGLSSVDITRPEGPGMGALLWAGFSMLVAAFVGGYVAARMSGLKRRADGILHGAVSWAVSTILFAVLATSVGGTLLSGVFSNMNQMASSAVGNSPSAAAAMVRGQLNGMDASSVQRFQQAIQSGQRDQAIAQLTSTMGVEPRRAAMIVDQALILSGNSASASPQARQQMENAVRGAGAAAWVLFVAVALALLLGIAGGAVGARGARRISWAGTPAAVRAS